MDSIKAIVTYEAKNGADALRVIPAEARLSVLDRRGDWACCLQRRHWLLLVAEDFSGEIYGPPVSTGRTRKKMSSQYLSRLPRKGDGHEKMHFQPALHGSCALPLLNLQPSIWTSWSRARSCKPPSLNDQAMTSAPLSTFTAKKCSSAEDGGQNSRRLP